MIFSLFIYFPCAGHTRRLLSLESTESFSFCVVCVSYAHFSEVKLRFKARLLDDDMRRQASLREVRACQSFKDAFLLAR